MSAEHAGLTQEQYDKAQQYATLHNALFVLMFADYDIYEDGDVIDLMKVAGRVIANRTLEGDEMDYFNVLKEEYGACVNGGKNETE